MIRPVQRAQHTKHIQSLGEFERLLAQLLDKSLSGVHLEQLDLREWRGELEDLDPRGAVFTDCQLPEGYDENLRAAGALVFPALPDFPFQPYRPELYTPEELYAGIEHNRYESVLDAQIYVWSTQEAADPRAAALAVSLHDHAINVALRDITDGLQHRIVGVMGGHAAKRGSEEYALAAHLGHGLAGAGYTVATGGGPGSMEAANLGASLYPETTATLQDVLNGFDGDFSSPTAWARSAWEIRQAFQQDHGHSRSIGIPTWAYGHEPPNLFANAIAKYFANAIREAILLQKCGAGIMFLPGAAGTIQEIFQDACENYYAPTSYLSPMVLLGKDYWTNKYPAWQLLQALAKGTPMEDYVFLVDDPAEAQAIVNSINGVED